MHEPRTARRSLAATLLLVSAAWLMPAHAGGPVGATVAGTSTDGSATSRRLTIKLRNSAPLARSASESPVPADLMKAMQDKARALRGDVTHLRNTVFDARVLELTGNLGPQEVNDILATIRAMPGVEYVELATRVQPQQFNPTLSLLPPKPTLPPLPTPSSPDIADLQWNLAIGKGGIRAGWGWSYSKGAGVTVAVLDSGYRPHGALPDIVAGYDFVSPEFQPGDGDGWDADATDPGNWRNAGDCGPNSPASSSTWHGTHVAGIVGGRLPSGVAFSGVAPQARIQPVRVTGKCGGDTADVAEAIVWASGGTVNGVPLNATPARVLNLSLGGQGTCDTTLQKAIDAARARGTAIVVAAGNAGKNAADFVPANCKGVMAVAATDKDAKLASYSNWQADLLAAPGGGSGAGIQSTSNDGTTGPGGPSYASLYGTSMAAPHVAGIAALMLSVDPALKPDEIATALRATGNGFASGNCTNCKLVDAGAAVARVWLPSIVRKKYSVEPSEPAGKRNLQLECDTLRQLAPNDESIWKAACEAAGAP